MKLRTLLAALGLALLASLPASAQVEPDPTTGVRQITSTSSSQDVILGPLTSRGTATIQLYGTWVGTYPIQGSLSRDCTTGGTFFTIPGTSSLTSNGGTQVTVAGIRCVKIPASGWSSGTTNVIIQASGTGGGTGGSSGGGAITFNGTTPTTGVGNADSGTLRVAIADDNEIAADVEASRGFLQTLSTDMNFIRNNLGAYLAEGADSVTSRAGPLQICFYQNIDGSALAVNALVDNELEPVGCSATAIGGQLVTMVNEDGSIDVGTGMLTSLQSLDDIVGLEDAAILNARGLAMVGFERRDVAASSAGADGENATPGVDALGLVWARFLDPCSGVAKQFLPINISTATTTEITPNLAGSGNHYYVCAIDIGPTAGAQNVALVDDDSDGCGSVTSGVAGGTTAATGWNAGANGGISHGNGLGSVAKTNGTNRVLCLVTSAAVQTSGVIAVVAAP
jgi:hypothetical protein